MSQFISPCCGLVFFIREKTLRHTATLKISFVQNTSFILLSTHLRESSGPVLSATKIIVAARAHYVKSI